MSTVCLSYTPLTDAPGCGDGTRGGTEVCGCNVTGTVIHPLKPCAFAGVVPGTGADIVNPTKTYQKGGTYPVALTVKDDSGLTTDTASAQIAVRVDQGPVAHAPASDSMK